MFAWLGAWLAVAVALVVLFNIVGVAGLFCWFGVCSFCCSVCAVPLICVADGLFC